MQVGGIVVDSLCGALILWNSMQVGGIVVDSLCGALILILGHFPHRSNASFSSSPLRIWTKNKLQPS